jgi:putative transposase
LAQRGIIVSYESIRLWVNKFGPKFAKKLKRKHGNFGDTFFIDEVFIKIDGVQHYLWRAVDQESLPHERSECFGYGDVVDVYLQTRRNAKAANKFFKRMLVSNKGKPREIRTDKLRSYNVAHRELMPDVIHNSQQYANNKAELSHQPTRVRERGMRKFKSVVQANRFLSAHKEVYNLFNLNRNLLVAKHYRELREGAFASWNQVVGL